LNKILTQPEAAISVGVMILFSRLIFGGKALFWGLPVLQFVPWQTEAFRQILQGSAPLWNPYNGLGAPLLANYQTAVFYPPTWVLLGLYALGGSPWLAWGEGLIIACHLILAGIGMARLLRLYNVELLGQTIGGMAFGLGQYLLARNAFYSMVWVGAWLPWVILAASQFGAPGYRPEKRTWFNPGLIICFAMQLLAGHAQLTWYTGVLAGLWVLVGAWQAGGFRHSLLSLVKLAVNISFSTAIAAVQLLPTAELLMLSQRAGQVNYDLAMTYSFWPWRLLTLFAPDMFGNPGQGNFWGYATYWEDALYMGVLPLVLAILTLLRMGKKANRQKDKVYSQLIVFAWTIIFAVFWLSLGKFTPLYAWLFNHVPTFSMFQSPARWMIWTAFGLALLAGCGTQFWSANTLPEKQNVKRWIAFSAAIVLGGIGALVVVRGINLSFVWATVVLGFWGMVIGFLTLIKPKKDDLNFPNWASLVCVLLLADILSANWGLLPAVAPSLFQENQVKAALGERRLYISPSEEYQIKYNQYFQFNSFEGSRSWDEFRQLSLPQVNILDGIYYLNNFDPLLPGRFDRWMKYIASLRPEKRIVWLKKFGVGGVLNLQGQTLYLEKLFTQTELQSSAQLPVWRGCAVSVKDENEAWNKTIDFMTQYLKTGQIPPVVLEGVAQNKSPKCNRETHGGNVNLTIQPGQLFVSINQAAGGWLELPFMFYPGWQAKLDGEVVDLYAADHLLMAVWVPAGDHELSINYQPFSFWAGWIISTVAVMIFIVILVWGSRKTNLQP
jgi:hypothetical protein